MSISNLTELYKARDFILQDKTKIEKLLELYVKEKEQHWKKVFDSKARVYKNAENQEIRATVFSIEYHDETWEEFFERKLSEDDVFLAYKERIFYREKALTKIEYKIDKELEKWGKSNEKL